MKTLITRNLNMNQYMHIDPQAINIIYSIQIVVVTHLVNLCLRFESSTSKQTVPGLVANVK